MSANRKGQWATEAARLVAKGQSAGDKASEVEVKELHAKIGQLTIEQDFLKKALPRNLWVEKWKTG